MPNLNASVNGELPKATIDRLLKKAADAEYGGSVDTMLKEGTFDGLAVAICTSCEEVYGELLEPDAGECYCDNCDEPAVTSVLIIAGLI